MIDRVLHLQRRPGKDYIHGADLFDALMALNPDWKKAQLKLNTKLASGALIVSPTDRRASLPATASLDITPWTGPARRLLVLPLPEHFAPVSSQEIPWDDLLQGSQINSQACIFDRLNPIQPLGLTTVTAAIEVLDQAEPNSEWLLAELDLSNPRGWPTNSSFSIILRRKRLMGKFASFTVAQAGNAIGSLHLARYQRQPAP